MNYRRWLAVGTLGLLLAAFPAAAYAQDALILKVPFPFIAGGATHPAGDYHFRVTKNRAELEMTPQKGAAAFALVESRLAEYDSTTPVDRVVFDKVGDRYYLSEVWLPGQDGYLFYAAKTAHTHETIKPEKKAT